MTGKPIETAINEKLTGEAQENALKFVTTLQANGFSFEGWEDGDVAGWDPTYNGKGGGCIMIPGELNIWLGLGWCFDDNSSVDDDLKEFAWEHVVVCPQKSCKPPYCEGDNHSKNRWQIFGKEFESTCHSPLAFFNPDSIKLEKIKRLLLTTV